MGESICSPGPLSIITHSSYLRTACLPCWRARGAKAGNGRWRRPCRRLRWCSIGSGPKYMICVHFSARCASQKAHRHARIARVSRAILVCPCVDQAQGSAARQAGAHPGTVACARPSESCVVSRGPGARWKGRGGNAHLEFGTRKFISSCEFMNHMNLK